MPQTTDIILNAAGYMIDPGTPQSPGYKRLQDGMPEGRTQRVAQTDFFGGGNRALQLERDTHGLSLNVGPSLNGQGVQPWGRFSTQTNTGFSAPANMEDNRISHCIVRDRLWIAAGKDLYSGSIVAPDTGGAWTLTKTYANQITDICIYNSKGLLIAFGDKDDIIYRDIPTGTETAILTGQRAWSIENYGGYAIWSDARTGTTPNMIQLATGIGINQRLLAHDAIRITTVGAELVIITKQSIYTFSGRVKQVMVNNPAYTIGGTQPAQIPGEEWSGEFTPFYQQGIYTERDDYAVFLGFGGRTLAWIGGGMHELLPSGDRAGWRSIGLNGKRCFGGCVAAGYVIVAIESMSAKNELWAYDGAGWWRLATQPMPAPGAAGIWCWPFPLGSGAVYNNVGVFRTGSNIIDKIRLVETTHTSGAHQSNMPASATFTTSMIDASERDKPKAWRKVGAVFAAPETYGNTGSGDSVAYFLKYSIDAGATWTTAASGNKVGNTLANMNFELSANLSGVVAPFILLRVEWSSVNDWSPILTGIWAEHEVLENPARRRKWMLRIHARDQEIDRGGVLFTRTGRQLIAELWSAWETDTALTFRDIDYDLAPVQRTVRIVGISETVTQPADSNQWGDSSITLNLVEV